LNRSVQRVALLLKTIVNERQGMTLTELGVSTKLPDSTVYRLLMTLEQQGLVERAGDGSGRYVIGLEMFRLGSAVLDRLGFGPQVMSDLEELASETGETVNLGVLHGFHVLYLQKVESQQTLRASLTIGSASVPAHCSATGKMMLASLPEAQLDALLASNPLTHMGPNSIRDPDVLRHELQRIREQGYSIDDLEFAADIRAVAAPILNHHGVTTAALAIAGPSSRLSLERTQSLVPMVMSMANRISRKIGYHG
jgi:IclR family acetate operon transcriptional repressor